MAMRWPKLVGRRVAWATWVVACGGLVLAGSEVLLRSEAHARRHRVAADGTALAALAAMGNTSADSVTPILDRPVDWGHDPVSYNCAGFAFRTYRPMGPEEVHRALSRFRPLHSAIERCEPGEIKFWLWEYDGHCETDDGLIGPTSHDGHLVAGLVTNADGSGPEQVYSKFNKGPIQGPAAPESFAPPARELVSDDCYGRRVYLVREHITERWYAAKLWQMPK